MSDSDDPMSIFTPVYAGIGAVASSYGGVEDAVRRLLSELLGDSSTAWLVARSLPTDTVINLCQRIIVDEPRCAPARPLARWILKAARKAGDRRADVTHGAWHLVEVEQGVHHGERMPVRHGAPLRMSAEDLEKEAMTLMAVAQLVYTTGHMVEQGLAASAYTTSDPSPLREWHDLVCATWGLQPFEWVSS